MTWCGVLALAVVLRFSHLAWRLVEGYVFPDEWQYPFVGAAYPGKDIPPGSATTLQRGDNFDQSQND
jgi:hypothetical protein